MNNQLIDTAIRHAVLLEQLKAGELNNLQAYYKEIDKIIREMLTRRELQDYARKAYQQFLKDLQKEIQDVLSDASSSINNKLIDIAVYEVAFEEKSLTKILEKNLKSVAKTPLVSSLTNAPLQVSGASAGKTVKEIINSIPTESQRLVNAVKVGYVQGKTNNEIISYIRGTKTNKYTDGILNVTKKNIDSSVRTLISHTATVAKEEVYKANDDIITGVQWVSTLDRRTTATCRFLDGKVFDQGSGPRPPIHYNCRSTVIPITRLSALFNKGATRASETGQVSADLTYYEWLGRQSSAFQDQALGTTRGKLFREGGLTLEQFAELQLDRSFRPITLERMKELEPLAFERAGL